MNKSVTILIPCYNGQNYLKRCLDSCVNQTYQNLKILVVNDGSTDESKKIIEEYMSKYPNINLINQTNSGIAKTRNILFANATTKYAFFLDVDDWLDPDCIEYFMNHQNNYDLMINAAWINKNNKQKSFYITDKINAKTNNETFLIQNAPFVWNVLFDMNFVRDNHFIFLETAPFLEDAIISLLIYKTKNIKFLNQPKYHYRFHFNSISHSNINSTKINYCLVQLEYFYTLIARDEFNKNFFRAINDQLAFYHSIIFSYIQFQAKLSRQEKKEFKLRLKNLEAQNYKIKFPKRYWKFWFFLAYRLFGY